MTPVWALLQPRGYLGGFVLYVSLAVGVIGLFFGGFEIAQPAFTGFTAGQLMPWFMLLASLGLVALEWARRMRVVSPIGSTYGFDPFQN